jgi:3-deoxy-manno-octulosonate cytidylyltransferase (CMP-KDO synthetase)
MTTDSTRPACYGIIPARYGSSRFPGKPLAMILGRPMFWHVWSRASACPDLARVVLATDDERILRAARDLGVEAVMTSPDHASGTDRILEAATLLGIGDEAVVVNIQGDEPALDPAMLSELVGPFADPAVRVTTLARRLAGVDLEQAGHPDRVKVVWTRQGQAMYFSRLPIPYARDPERAAYWLHIGLYGFRMSALRRFAELGPSPLEQTEKLEQLRLLENGIPIRVVPTERVCHGVDRPEDIPAVTQILMET